VHLDSPSLLSEYAGVDPEVSPEMNRTPPTDERFRDARERQQGRRIEVHGGRCGVTVLGQIARDAAPAAH
jgi:hypothetical protein